MNRALLWGLLLLLPNMIFVGVADDPLDALIRSLPPALPILTGLICWTRRPGLVLVLLSPLYFLLPFEAYYILQYGQPSTPHILAVISESNPREALEYVGLGRMVAGFSLGLALVVVTLRIARGMPRLPAHRMARLLGFASVVPLLIYAWLEWDWSEMRTHFDAYAAQAPEERLMTPEFATPIGGLLSDSYPFGIAFRIRDFLGEQALVREAAETLLKHDFHAVRTIDSSEPEVYVLVIGESARPDHIGIAGYARQTTPELAGIRNVIGLRNVVTPWSSTRQAVPLLLTGEQTGAHSAPLGRASIVSLFKQAGFRTYWISNQAPVGVHDSMIAMHAREADEVVYTNGGDYTQRSAYDDAMLPVFDRFLREPAKKKLFVIHMLGSHKRYDRRYPPAFDKWQPSIKSDSGKETDEEIANSYDNSILFTDYVLSRMIVAMNNTAPLGALLYLSDHGQNLPSEACPSSGHGTRYEVDYRVAALLWASAAYVETFPQLWATAQERADAPLYSTGAFHTLADLAHIMQPEHKPRLSWVSESWKPIVRWVDAVPDFDLAQREPPCQKLRMPRSPS